MAEDALPKDGGRNSFGQHTFIEVSSLGEENFFGATHIHLKDRRSPPAAPLEQREAGAAKFVLQCTTLRCQHAAHVRQQRAGMGTKEPEMDLIEINAFWRWEPTKKWYTFPWALLLVACASVNGTPMRGSADCGYVPSVEDCQMVADRIEDLCLRTCVVHLCRRGRAVCDEAAQVICVELSKEHPGQETGGWVSKGPQTCEMPKEEVNWCQTPHSPLCQAKMMVHELAHACGWHHGEGQGVPSSDGSIKCL